MSPVAARISTIKNYAPVEFVYQVYAKKQHAIILTSHARIYVIIIILQKIFFNASKLTDY